MPISKTFQFRPGTFSWAICERCDGHGSHDHPAFATGISSEDWADWDDDARSDYLHGRYDVACSECAGAGKVRQPLPGRLSFGELRQLAAQARQDRARAEVDAERRAEQRHLGYEA